MPEADTKSTRLCIVCAKAVAGTRVYKIASTACICFACVKTIYKDITSDADETEVDVDSCRGK